MSKAEEIRKRFDKALMDKGFEKKGLSEDDLKELVTSRGQKRIYRREGGQKPKFDAQIGARVPSELKKKWEIAVDESGLRRGEGLEQALELHLQFMELERAVQEGALTPEEIENNIKKIVELYI